ncbi:hypothetical protein MBLNU13_g07165t1 [Cladosporium sp. NU13]
MHRCFFSIILWAISTSALAPAGVPACAQPAINSGIRRSGCATDDFSCICANENLNFALQSASDLCNDDDQQVLCDAVWKACSEHILGTRDVNEDNDGAGQASTPTIATEDPNQATLSTPTIIASPTTPLPTSATSLATDTREFSHPTTPDSSNVMTTQQADDDPNGLISATTTSPGPEDTALLSSNATRNTSSLRGQDPSSITGKAVSEVALSVGALVVAVAGLTWVFAEF